MPPPSATHAYLSVYDGKVEGIAVDLKDHGTAEFVSECIRSGGEIHRVPLDQARGAMHQAWPLAIFS